MKKIVLSAFAATTIYANDTEIEALKAQMEQMSKMMQSMQAKIDRLEKEKSQTVASKSTENEEEKSATTQSVSQKSIASATSLLNPSLIVDMAYVSRNIPDEKIGHMELPGVAHGLYGSHSHGEHSHAVYNAEEGFNLNYAELAFGGTIDPMFDAAAVFHIADGSIEIEEGYMTTREMPYNLRIKGGKFLSDFGRINSQHQHAWSFSMMPLVYNAFLGDHGIDEIGAQLQWVAPVSTYLMFGAEALQGKNESMFGNKALASPYDAEVFLSESADQPSLYVGYAKTSFDIGDTSILAGASIAHGESRIDHFGDEDPHAFSGEGDVYGVDLTLKHTFDSYSSLTWQSEWLYRDLDGVQFADRDGDLTTEDMIAPNIRKKQAGFYSELVYALDQTWRAGIRYDDIYKNDVEVKNTLKDLPQDFDQITAMIEYHTSEFMRFRLEYLHSNALYNEEEEQETLDALMFSVNFALGAHGAHAF